ncbi:haloacid dehalogenase-like hydrolase [Pleurocapsa sp. PCC 7319]|uniref:haloacid dehalogenase-like hydrolase n=1 Tax=Pleurocapsa sp. PCC 7319 TaxID=118161 RepID=UPI0003468E43|nr:haloacid dehalogenase-like hydrolase [Pleurocapsa sp. PCC 7319]
MSKATKLVSNRIAIVFDFDETLIPDDSFKVLLQDCQIDIDSFIGDRVDPLVADGWDKYLARAYCLIKESQQREDKNKITQSKLAKLGKKLELYDGVSTMFERLQQQANTFKTEIELEFYLISGGFVDIPRNTSVAKYFRQMWGCEFHYGDQGEIEFLKRQMTHTEKTRYLYYISKGIERENEKDLIYNYQDLSNDKIHVPLNQVIYVGDGTSDIPCFTVINQYGGIAIGIYSKSSTAEKWEHLEKVNSSQRLSNLVPANYEEDSEMMQSLSLAIDCISNRIALGNLSAGE